MLACSLVHASLKNLLITGHKLENAQISSSLTNYLLGTTDITPHIKISRNLQVGVGVPLVYMDASLGKTFRGLAIFAEATDSRYIASTSSSGFLPDSAFALVSFCPSEQLCLPERRQTEECAVQPV